MTAPWEDEDLDLDLFIPTQPKVITLNPLAEEVEDEDLFLPKTKPILTDTSEEQVQAILLEVPTANPQVVQDLVKQSTKVFIDTLLSPDLSKRARWARDDCLQNGFTTLMRIQEVGGYNQRYAVIRDLISAGVPMAASVLQTQNKRRTTLYTFDPQAFQAQKESRMPLSDQDMDFLRAKFNFQCNICYTDQHRRTLHADHRIPFDLVGNALYKSEGLPAFQPLCGSCNSKKRQACLDCHNDDPAECYDCRWAHPEKYTHIALVRERRYEMVLHDPQLIQDFDVLWQKIRATAAQERKSPGEILLRKLLTEP